MFSFSYKVWEPVDRTIGLQAEVLKNRFHPLAATLTSHDLLKADRDKMIFDLIKWTADSANRFYRGLHSHGVWIHQDDVRRLSVCGWGVTDPNCIA